MFAAAVMLLVPKVFEAGGRRRWKLAASVGVLLGLEMLTKITALTMILTIAATLVLQFWFSQRSSLHEWRGYLGSLAPWSAVVLLPAVMSGWYFARCGTARALTVTPRSADSPMAGCSSR